MKFGSPYLTLFNIAIKTAYIYNAEGHNKGRGMRQLLKPLLNIFDKIIGYTTIYLVNDKKFWNEHGDFIKKNPRGFGYWIWKPYLIKKTLEKAQLSDKLYIEFSESPCLYVKTHGIGLLFISFFPYRIQYLNSTSAYWAEYHRS